MTQPLLKVTDLKKHYAVTEGVILQRTRGYVHAVDGVSFELGERRTVALVGESGSGKTTTGKIVMKMLEPTSGEIELDGVKYSSIRGKSLFDLRKQLAMVFQDPYASLDPRRSVERIIDEPLRVHKWGSSKDRAERVDQLMEQVGLNPNDKRRLPHQFSGGQRQRISIARALTLSPKLVVADEPVSSLDVSVQAKIINLMMDLKRKFNLSYLFIAHDLSVVKYVSDDVIVMYLGKIVETAPKEALFTRPLHPYTMSLIAAIPLPDPELMQSNPPKLLSGETPSPINPPTGCRFNTRCQYAQSKCSKEEPQLEQADTGHFVACHFWREIGATATTRPLRST